jgi:hypothetical protein
MWSLTSLRTKRIGSFRKFRLLPPKDFFNSIDPEQTFWREADISRRERRTKSDDRDGEDRAKPDHEVAG